MKRNIGVVQTVELIKELYDVKNNVSMFLNICNVFLSESALRENGVHVNTNPNIFHFF